jgi:phosphomannomutase
MRADRAELNWDAGKSKWLVRISAGEEVIRRYCELPQNAGEQELRAVAEKTLQDEGYELDGTAIKIQQTRVA